MDNYDLTSYLVGIVVEEVGKPFHYDSEFDLYWDALRNPFLNLLEKERPEYNQHDSTMAWRPVTAMTSDLEKDV